MVSCIRRPFARAAVAPADTSAITYVICTNPRSGSWLLSEGLAATGVAGNPREWFNMAEEQRQRALWRLAREADLTPAGYLARVRVRSTSANGVSGTKLHHYQFVDLPRKLNAVAGLQRLSPAAAMARLYPDARYIWLTRRDKARQAISFLIASATDRWWDIPGAEADARDADPAFDPAAIARLERAFGACDERWQRFFEANGIVPLTIAYEDLVADYAGTIRSVLTWLGVEGADNTDIRPPRLRRQSGARNEVWLRRYNECRSAHAADVAEEMGENPLAGRVPAAAPRLPEAWKRWIARAGQRGEPLKTITDVLVRNGVARQLAEAEAHAALSGEWERTP